MPSNNDKTKNDKAWEEIFEEDKILEHIAKCGYYEIDSERINKVRQSRLMAKFDHYVNLPKIFKSSHLSILPISRSKYLIGYFDTHYKVEYSNSVEIIPFEFPEQVESVDYANLYSESSALHCAFLTKIIDDLAGEETIYTVSGRMSTKEFNFKIKSSKNEKYYPINVENAQCEIDGGFESENYFLLVEAKNYSIDDFMIRQLYYPYRLWSSKLSKQVIPVLMTYSNDMFSFFIYKFDDALDYNSLSLVKQKNYIIAPENIQLEDVNNIFKKINLIAKKDDVPFPQADNFERVVDLLSLLVERDLTRDEITENYQFDVRQTNYYTDACRYIGLVNKYKKSGFFCLTDEGKDILSRHQKNKYIALIKKILEHEIFYKTFELSIKKGETPSQEEVCKVMLDCGLTLSSTTIERRSQTVRKWIDWIWSQIE
ncbi:translation elongation factor [Phormidium sp. LEGE 05292]|uniref:type II restriction enzyme n=1 Tax=[Phormidium] sp. LEGE 05292 TaxID=767427 RepID=UPI001882327B|nr:translation elongation factor [Phormidium sp. LEGE 05292]MBE9229881.1 translation elongation factor [Phormidium sp. LEGE 05292]